MSQNIQSKPARCKIPIGNTRLFLLYLKKRIFTIPCQIRPGFVWPVGTCARRSSGRQPSFPRRNGRNGRFRSSKDLASQEWKYVLCPSVL